MRVDPNFPIRFPLSENAKLARHQRVWRAIAIAVLIGIFIAVVVQFEIGTVRRTDDDDDHKGAIARWSRTIPRFWNGENIYTTDTLHPNMPFTVILLTPLSLLAPAWQALVLSLLKLLAVLSVLLMAARLASDDDKPIADWVIGLALLWGLQILISDFQHGNTNTFVLFFVTLQLWLFRKGQDLWAGAALAVAICLKMTPALFVLYWLYQRQWKMLGFTAMWGLIFVGVVPALFVGVEQHRILTTTWLENLIFPGLVEGAWYPIHVNQSLSGTLSRYLLTGPNGNIFWNPDDIPNYANIKEEQWITLVAMTEAHAKMVIRIGQVAIVGLIAWAVGWTKLPRTDGRRMLHYGLVALGMMILNQRTWMHHATVTFLASLAIWQGIAFGHITARARQWAMGLMVAAGFFVWFNASDLYEVIARAAGYSGVDGEHWADVADAYGPTLVFFLLMFAASVVLCAALRKSDPPYAQKRQKINDGLPE
jgi:hypothetical protein